MIYFWTTITRPRAMYVINKAWSKELEILKKSSRNCRCYIATMTFQNGRYFPFEVI